MIESNRIEPQRGLGPPLSPEEVTPDLRAKARKLLPRTLQGKCDTSDIVQDALLDAHRDLGQFRGSSPQEYRSWLAKILASAVSRVRRRFIVNRKRQVLRERLTGTMSTSGDFFAALPASTDTPGTKAANRELIAAAEAALGKLPSEHREVMRLRYEEKLDWEEIGVRMNRSSNAVRSLWYRAIDALRTTLGAADDFYDGS